MSFAGTRTDQTIIKRRPVVRLAVCVFATFVANTAAGSTIEANSTTLGWYAPQWRLGNIEDRLPFIEWVNLSARGIDSSIADELRIDVSAWGAWLPIRPSGSRSIAGDVDLAFAQGRFLNRRLNARVGRQTVTGGASRFTHFDGLLLEGAIYSRLGASIYGGLPVLSRFAVGKGDAVAGGRLYWRQSFDTEVGVSFVQLQDNSLSGRQDLGADARYAVTYNIILSGSAVWSLLESRMADADVAAHWQILPTVQLTADYRHVSPDLYLSRTSIFSVFADSSRDAVGLFASWAATQRIDTYIEYHLLRTPDGSGHDAGGRFRYRVARTADCGVDLRAFEVPINGYLQARFWGAHHLSKQISLSGDLDGTWLSEDINGIRRSILVGLSGKYAFASRWAFLLNGSAGSTPFFSQVYQVIARLTYDFSTLSGARP